MTVRAVYLHVKALSNREANCENPGVLRHEVTERSASPKFPSTSLLTAACTRSDDTPIGWNAYAGQTLSAYRREGLDEKDQAVSFSSPFRSRLTLTRLQAARYPEARRRDPPSASPQASPRSPSGPRRAAPTCCRPASAACTA